MHVYIYMYIYMYIHYVCTAVCMLCRVVSSCACVSVCVCVCLSVYLSVCLSVQLCGWVGGWVRGGVGVGVGGWGVWVGTVRVDAMSLKVARHGPKRQHSTVMQCAHAFKQTYSAGQDRTAQVSRGHDKTKQQYTAEYDGNTIQRSVLQRMQCNARLYTIYQMHTAMQTAYKRAILHGGIVHIYVYVYACIMHTYRLGVHENGPFSREGS